jgi:hypothetical protein
VGVAVCSDPSETADGILRVADAEMYRDKQARGFRQGKRRGPGRQHAA